VSPRGTGRAPRHAELRGAVREMALQVEQAVRQAVAALEAGDEARAREVVAGDARIDRAEQAIEQACVRWLAERPTGEPEAARSARTVAAVLKAATDLERAGDHAAGIAKTALRIGPGPRIRPVFDVPRMAELAAGTLIDAAEAFAAGDVDRARQAALRDDAVDALYDQIFRELITSMLDDRSTVRQATHLLFVASHLERIGDYATNVAEWTIFVETGERVELND
jgi:phosphate transport system protein